MENNKCPSPTMENLLIKKEERDVERKRKNLAISLDICPVCGCKIIDQNLEIFNPPKKYFFNLITISKKWWGFRKVCSNDKSHYDYKYNYDNHSDY